MPPDNLDGRSVQLIDAEPGGRQGADVPAGPMGPLLPHLSSMAPLLAASIPRNLGSTTRDGGPNVDDMTHQVQYTAAGEGAELTAPDAVLTVKIDADHTDGQYELFEVDAPRGPATPPHRTGWGKAYYVLQGRLLVQVEAEGFDLGPGSSVTIPPGALHTFTVLSPAARFLVVSLGAGMGRFHADLDATVPHGRPFEEIAGRIQEVLDRHDVAVAGLETVR
jgi:quercetin dioxygenase-like cupin family protein